MSLGIETTGGFARGVNPFAKPATPVDTTGQVASKPGGTETAGTIAFGQADGTGLTSGGGGIIAWPTLIL